MQVHEALRDALKNDHFQNLPNEFKNLRNVNEAACTKYMIKMQFSTGSLYVLANLNDLLNTAFPGRRLGKKLYIRFMFSFFDFKFT